MDILFDVHYDIDFVYIGVDIDIVDDNDLDNYTNL